MMMNSVDRLMPQCAPSYSLGESVEASDEEVELVRPDWLDEVERDRLVHELISHVSTGAAVPTTLVELGDTIHLPRQLFSELEILIDMGDDEEDVITTFLAILTCTDSNAGRLESIKALHNRVFGDRGLRQLRATMRSLIS